MARITRDTGERIFSITRWRGVNEAPEGEASLKSGEAAEMRNFCVTSGGALKKRPGSRNVAGLMNKYTAHVREGSRRLLMTDVGEGKGYEMYPRIVADEVGKVRPAGGAVTVTTANAGEHEGYFYEKDGACWELDGCERSGGDGEAITGGTARPGELTQFSAGTVRTRATGNEYTGESYIDVYPEAYVGVDDTGKTVVGVRGQSVRRAGPVQPATGWVTQNVGGYVIRGGLWRYYGIKVELCRASYRWSKYKCSLSEVGHTYYTEGSWISGGLRQTTTGVEAYTSYTFDETSGTYRLSGRIMTIYPGESGVLYGGASDGIERLVISPAGSGWSNIVAYRPTVNGPYTYNTTEYSRGAAVGEVTVPEGQWPEADRGTYVTQFSYGGGTYTVMRLGQDYFCYVKASGTPEYYDIYYGYHGYPMDVTADTYRWYFNETYSQPGEAGDTAVRGIWSGFVGGREVLCAACGGMLWELKEENGTWEKVYAGEMDTSGDVHMFGFDEKLYILGGGKYLVWDGERLSEVEGYRPLVAVSTPPEGGGTLLEAVNRLTAGRRCRFSPDGTAKTFKLPEEDIAGVDWVKDLTGAAEDGAPYAATAYTADISAGTVTFTQAPPRGVNSLEIAWSAKSDYADEVRAMGFAEVYNGAQDTRVFIYGDGSNRALYSGLDYNGRPRADYFPDLCEVAVGDANTPITAMIRHYDKLMVFKLDSAWSIGYDAITLADGTVTAGFYVAPVNRATGNCAPGQARLVQNRPRTLDGRSVIEWRGSSGITGDQRNAERVSQRVDSSIRKFDLTKARTFYDKFSHEYFVIGEDGTAIVQNLDVDAWYVYTGLHMTCMINYQDELYYGTGDGYLRHFSDRYSSDNGEAIDAYWESGAISFSQDFRRKYSATVWIGIKPEDNGYLEVTARTDRRSDFAVFDVAGAGASGLPETERIKLKAKKFTYYKLILRNYTADRTCTVVSADLRVRGAGYVR